MSSEDQGSKDEHMTTEAWGMEWKTLVGLHRPTVMRSGRVRSPASYSWEWEFQVRAPTALWELESYVSIPRETQGDGVPRQGPHRLSGR